VPEERRTAAQLLERPWLDSDEIGIEEEKGSKVEVAKAKS
jgi:hypothetical protein